MKVTHEEINPTKKRLLVEIPSEEVGPRVEQAFREVAKSARIPGFRPGKAPRRLLESYYGEKIREDVGRNIVSETLPKAIEQAEIRPLTMPILEKSGLTGSMDFNYTAVLDVYPQFKVENYLGLEIETEPSTMSEEEVERQITFIREANGKLIPLEEGKQSEKGDFVLIDYQGYANNQPLEDVKADNMLLRLGSNEFHPAFEDALVGCRKGQQLEFTVNFEETFHRPSLSGKSVLFKVSVQDVKWLDVKELNDEFVQSLNAGLNTVEDLRQKVREELLDQERKRSENRSKRLILEQICKTVEFPLPEVLVETEHSSAVEGVISNITRNGATLEKFGLSREKLWQDMRPVSEQRVKEMMVLEEIASRENIDVNEDDVDRELSAIAARGGQDAGALKKYYAQAGMLGTFRRKLREEKTLNYLLHNAKVHKNESAGPDEGSNMEASQ